MRSKLSTQIGNTSNNGSFVAGVGAILEISLILKKKTVSIGPWTSFFFIERSAKILTFVALRKNFPSPVPREWMILHL